MNIEGSSKHLAQLFSMVINLVLLAVIMALSVIVMRQLTGDTLVVKALNVPSQLESQGYTGEVAAQLIVDGMQTIQVLANTRISRRNLIPDASRLDIEMPGSGLSVKTIGRVLRESLGMSEASVSGDIVRTDTGYRLHLRYIDGASFRMITPLDSDSIDGLLDEGAEKSMEMVNPFLLAAYLYGRGLDDPRNGVETVEGRERFVALLKMCFENENREDDSWANNLWGMSLASEGQFIEAIEKYKSAIEGDSNFALAYNNWGNVLLNIKRYEEAEEKFSAAIAKDQNLVTAMTGRLFAQGMNLDGKGNYREAIRKFEAALVSDPDFADAHARLGRALDELISTQDSDDVDLESRAEMARKVIHHYRMAQQLEPDTYQDQLDFSINRMRRVLESLQ